MRISHSNLVLLARLCPYGCRTSRTVRYGARLPVPCGYRTNFIIFQEIPDFTKNNLFTRLKFFRMGFVNWSAFIIQLVNISIIVFVLNRFLFRPYLAYLDEETRKREQVVRDYTEQAERKKATEKEITILLDQAKKDAQEMILQAELLAKKETSSIIDQAKQEAEQIKAKALKDINGEREALYKELRERVLSIALRANEKLFGKKEVNAEFIAQAIKEENI